MRDGRGSLRGASLLVAILAITSACSTGGGASPAASSGPSALAGTSWALTNMGSATPATAATLIFAADNAGGLAGCNTFTGAYTATASALTFGPLATTRKLCEPAANTFEVAYLAALAKVAKYTIDGTTLTLSDTSGAALLTYAAAAPTDIEGSWEVTGFNTGSAVSSVALGSTIDMTFDAEGQVSGNSGCNQFSGGYSTDGNSIAIGPLMSTMRACADEAVNTQEQQFLAALDQAETWSISGDHLELRGAGDAIMVSAIAAAQ